MVPLKVAADVELAADYFNEDDIVEVIYAGAFFQVTSVTGHISSAAISAAESAESASAAASSETASASSETVCLAASHFVGAWVDQTGAHVVPTSVYHNGDHWNLLNDTADITAIEPGVSSEWAKINDNASPVGSITAFIGGYFTNNVNGGFTSSVNTAAAINALLNVAGWYVCDGAALNIAGSDYYDGSGRYLPQLTDDRFIMGDTATGGIGGSSTMSHTHVVDVTNYSSGASTITTSQIPSHRHNISGHYASGGAGTVDAVVSITTTTAASAYTDYYGGGGSHTHWCSPAAKTSGAASVTENRPKFLSCLYIMRVV